MKKIQYNTNLIKIRNNNIETLRKLSYHGSNSVNTYNTYES